MHVPILSGVCYWPDVWYSSRGMKILHCNCGGCEAYAGEALGNLAFPHAA